MHPIIILCAVLIGLDAIFRRGTPAPLDYTFAAVVGFVLYLTTGFLIPGGPFLSPHAMTALHLLCCYLCIRLMWCGSGLGLLRCAILFNAAVAGAFVLWYFALQLAYPAGGDAAYFLLFLLGVGLLFQQSTGLLIFLALLVLLVGTSCTLAVRSAKAVCRRTGLAGPGKLLLFLTCFVPFLNLLPLLALFAWSETARPA